MGDIDDAIAQLKKVVPPVEYDHYGNCTTCGAAVPATVIKIKIDEDNPWNDYEPITICICKTCASAIETIAREKEAEHDYYD